jgi:hypothetical protein
VVVLLSPGGGDGSGNAVVPEIIPQYPARKRWAEVTSSLFEQDDLTYVLID